jgi:hypothetical protein
MAAPNPPTTPASSATPQGLAANIAQDIQNVSDFAASLGAAALQINNVGDIAKQAVAALSEQTIFSGLQQSIDLLKKRTQQQEDLDRQTVMTSALLERVTGMNALARRDVITQLGPDSLISKASADTFKAVNDYGEATIKFLNGTEVRALAVFGDINELFETFNAAILDDTRLTVAAQRGITYDLVENTRLATKQLGLSQADVNEIFQKELSETGKISGEALKDFEKTVLTTAQSTGLGVTLITKDLAKMTSDFSHFGMMTTDQMASLSVNIHQLGMDISDVTRLADNFSSFDKAASTMSNLAASTGATLDTLELFRLANTDQEEFIRSLRSQLEDQGVEFENLNFIQQKQIASSFGIDPRVAQRLLSDNFDMVTNITDQISSKKEETTDEQLRMTLASLGSLREEAMKVDAGALAARYASLKTASAAVAENLETVYSQTLQITDIGVSKLGGGLDALAEKAHMLRDSLIKFTDTSIKDVLGTNTALAKKYASYGKTASSAFASAFTEGLDNSQGLIFQVGTGMGSNLPAGLRKGAADAMPGSPSKIGKEITLGLELAFDKFADDKIASRFGGTLSEDIKKTLAAKRDEITRTISGIGRDIEAEATVATLSGDSQSGVNELIASRYKDILTADQVAKMRSGESGVAAVVTELYDAQIKKMSEKPVAATETNTQGQATTSGGQPTKIEVSPQDIKVHITLSGGDALTQVLVNEVIGRAIGDGISVSGYSNNVRLATVGAGDSNVAT